MYRAVSVLENKADSDIFTERERERDMLLGVKVNLQKRLQTTKYKNCVIGKIKSALLL